MYVPPILQRWSGRRVLITGCTGFKGAWLTAWLSSLGAEVSGLALPPPTTPSLWAWARLDRDASLHEVDLRATAAVRATIRQVAPDAVFHLGAVSLVNEGLADPLGTLATNVLGTAAVLEGIRDLRAPCAAIVVTTDKVYAARSDGRAHRERDPLGAADPYSTSKACAELVVQSWAHSYLPPDRLAEHGVCLATVRAGNVVGPGDYTESRLVPHLIERLARGDAPALRDPDGVRPWQYVLEPLAGYLALGARLLPGAPPRPELCSAFNFGPHPDAARPVRDVEASLRRTLRGAPPARRARTSGPAETPVLRLDSDKAAELLGWRAALTFDETFDRTAAGYRDLRRASDATACRALMTATIATYLDLARERQIPWTQEDPDVPHRLPRLRVDRAAPRPGPGPHPPRQPHPAG